MLLHHYHVKWAGITRYAKAKDKQEACKKAFGLVAENMLVYDFGARNPKYLSATKKHEIATSDAGWTSFKE